MRGRGQTSRELPLAGNWAAAYSLLQPWLDFQSMIGSKLPLRVESEVCLLAHDALRAQGIEANALLERARVAFKPGEVERAREGR